MQVFVINLERDAARRAFITSQLDSLNLSYRLTAAIDGTMLTEADYNQLVDRAAIAPQSKWIPPGAIGCALSHLQVYKTIVQEQLPYALVLEDDCVLHPALSEVLSAIPQLLKDYEVLLLDYKSWDSILLRTAATLDQAPDFKICQLANQIKIGSAAAYVITQEAARRLSDELLPVRTSADHWQHFQEKGWIGDLRFIYPKVVSTASFKSSIDYVKSDSLVGLLTRWVDKHRIFPLYQFLAHRRKKMLRRLQDIKLIE